MVHRSVRQSGLGGLGDRLSGLRLRLGLSGLRLRGLRLRMSGLSGGLRVSLHPGGVGLSGARPLQSSASLQRRLLRVRLSRASIGLTRSSHRLRLVSPRLSRVSRLLVY